MQPPWCQYPLDRRGVGVLSEPRRYISRSHSAATIPMHETRLLVTVGEFHAKEE